MDSGPNLSDIFGPAGPKDSPGPKTVEIFGPAGPKLTRTKYFVTVHILKHFAWRKIFGNSDTVKAQNEVVD